MKSGGDVVAFGDVDAMTGALATRAVWEDSDVGFADAAADLMGRFTWEFAIRTLLKHDLDRALDIIEG
ncbi:hypothetical protein HQO84_25475 [Rhodococcus fascians]|nr:hypothetical protein [Rhodococcus fascians]MBY3999469.1 hypothetical protein [Rhodococcus fascians]MBY4005002.1 hypothetical protein [Rhodococcus fascians]MBY4010125.1 hypothetical protein [Rhodococcus fascians]MBY4020209.1 hypothetical protein [Rhodococcus fascians]